MAQINAQSEQARESARKSDGKFGSYSSDESGATLSPDSELRGIVASEERLRRQDSDQNGELADIIESYGSAYDHSREVLNKITAHEVLNELREENIDSVRVLERPYGEGFEVSHANTYDGEVDDSVDQEKLERIEGSLNASFNAKQMSAVFEEDSPDDLLKGWRVDAKEYGTGEPVNPGGQTMDQLRAERKKIIADHQPRVQVDTMLESGLIDYDTHAKLRDVLREQGQGVDDHTLAVDHAAQLGVAYPTPEAREGRTEEFWLKSQQKAWSEMGTEPSQRYTDLTDDELQVVSDQAEEYFRSRRGDG